MPGEEIPVCRLADLFVAAWGERLLAGREPSDSRTRPTFAAFIDKALHQLGWRPRWSLAEAVRRTAAMVSAVLYCRAVDAREACLNDIHSYESDSELMMPPDALSADDRRHIVEHTVDLWEPFAAGVFSITGGTGFLGTWLFGISFGPTRNSVSGPAPSSCRDIGRRFVKNRLDLPPIRRFLATRATCGISPSRTGGFARHPRCD